METKEQKQYYVIVNGQKVEVTEEVYRAYVRPVRAQQRTEKRNKRCKIKGERFGLVRCTGDCSKCEYAKSGKPLGGAEQSLEALAESGFELPSESDMETELIIKEEREERSAAVNAAVEQLSERQRYVVKAVFFESATQAQIAARLGVKQATVSTTLNRALKNLKKFLKDF